MDENLNVEETVEETVDTEEMVDFKAKYEEALKEAEKYKGYFKKEKAKQKNAKEEPPSVDLESLESKIMQKVEFYTTHPAAKDLKADIDSYMEAWLDIEKAYKLAAAEKDPSLLIDSQTKAKQEAPKKELTGVANADWGWIDFASMTDTEALQLTPEQQEQYWEYKKRA